MVKRCIFCDKPVKWLRGGGTAMAFDAEPVGYVPDDGDDVIFAPGSGLVKGRAFGTPAKGFPVGYKAHYLSCVLAKRAMARRRRDEAARTRSAARAAAAGAAVRESAAAAAARAAAARESAAEGGGNVFDGEQLSLFLPDAARFGDVVLWA
jgi:hypothetical protein